MKISVPDRSLLMKLTSLAKTLPKTGNYRFVADNNLLSLYTEFSAGYAKGIVSNIEIIEPGEVAVPSSIIPTLTNASYPLTITKEHRLNIKHKTSGPKGLNLNIMSEPEFIGINPTTPNWLDDIEEIKEAVYLMNSEDSKIWITDTTVAVGDRFRFVIFRKELGVQSSIITAGDFQKYYDLREKTSIFLDNKKVWFGNDGYYIIISTIDTEIPKRLVELINSEPDYNFLCIVNREELSKSLSTAKMFLKEDLPPFLDLTFKDNVITMLPIGNSIGSGSPEVEAIRINNEYYVKLNVHYLSQAVNNCKSNHLVISNLTLGSLTLFTIKDGEILHYIVPMV